METIKQFIVDVFESLMYRSRRLVHDIRAVFSAYCMMWGNYEWDPSFFLDFVLWKLNRMEAFFMGPETYILNAEKYAKQIREVIDNINISQQEETHPDVIEKLEVFEKKAGERYWSVTDEPVPEWLIVNPEDFITDKEGNSKGSLRHMVFWFKNATNPEQNNEWMKESVALHLEDEKLKQKALQKAFQLIGKNLLNWWD